MPLTPDELRAKRFSVTLRRGYEREEVDKYLKEVAAELDEIRNAPPPELTQDDYERIGSEVGAVLRSAKETADSILQRAEEQARVISQRAGAKAAELHRDARQSAATMRATAEDDARKIVGEAEGRARQRLDEAEAYARELRETTERQAEQLKAETNRQTSELLDDAVRRHEALIAHERELRERIEAVEQALFTLRAMLDRADEDRERVAAQGRLIETVPEEGYGLVTRADSSAS